MKEELNPLAMGKFLKVNNIPEVLEINKQHSYRSDITFKTAASPNQFLSHQCLTNQNLKAFIQYNRIFRLGIIMDINTEYTKEEMLQFMKAELPV
jgi:hypothetical protein